MNSKAVLRLQVWVWSVEALLGSKLRKGAGRSDRGRCCSGSELAKIDDLERLLRYPANFDILLDNFVNMSDLYDPKRQAVFQMGTLYMDARACTLCFHVDDIEAHAAQAATSKCCLAYCTLKRPGSSETKQICAAFTAGFARTLWVVVTDLLRP